MVISVSVHFSFRRDYDKSSTSILGHPPDANMMAVSRLLCLIILQTVEEKRKRHSTSEITCVLGVFQLQPLPQPPLFLQPPAGATAALQGDSSSAT